MGYSFDKCVKKLEKFDELPAKKKKKLFSTIFCGKEFREWYFQVGESKDNQPMTNAMIKKLMNLLARPQIIRELKEFIDSQDYETFDHTTAYLAFMVADTGVDSLNTANSGIKEESDNGLMSTNDVRKYSEKSEKYMSLISDFLDVLKDKLHKEIKNISNRSNLPKDMIRALYCVVPGKAYIPPYKVSGYTSMLLREAYKYTGANGIDDIRSIRWGEMFKTFFGDNMTPSVALAILMEGVKRIENYADTDHFQDVKSIWNSLTNYALAELDNASEETRRQMMELYIKKASKLFHNGNGPKMRINILAVPSEFSRLHETVMRYSDRIQSIVGTDMGRPRDNRDNYNDRRRDDRRDRDDRKRDRGIDTDDLMNRPKNRRDEDSDEGNDKLFGDLKSPRLTDNLIDDLDKMKSQLPEVKDEEEKEDEPRPPRDDDDEEDD